MPSLMCHAGAMVDQAAKQCHLLRGKACCRPPMASKRQHFRLPRAACTCPQNNTNHRLHLACTFLLDIITGRYWVVAQAVHRSSGRFSSRQRNFRARAQGADPGESDTAGVHCDLLRHGHADVILPCAVAECALWDLTRSCMAVCMLRCGLPTHGSPWRCTCRVCRRCC